MFLLNVVPPEQKSSATVPEEELPPATPLLSDSPASEGGNTEAQANER